MIKYIFLFIFTFLYSNENLINQYFGTIILNDNIIEQPFVGGFNKPKIQWVDWDGDGADDLFVLDEDGSLKYFNNNSIIISDPNLPHFAEYDFKLITTSFQNIIDISWFYFADFDNDGDIELITQDPLNVESMLFYENYNNNLYLVNSVLDNNNELITIQSVMTPTFADIDGDLDLDFFVGNVIGTVSMYENISDESSSTPVFELITNFWQDIYIVGSSQRHGASAIAFIDLDGDNDLDLAWGDYYQQSLYAIWNIGDINNPIMDINNIDTQYPPGNPIVTAGLNMPSSSDINLNGVKDLFITVLSGSYGFQLINNFYFYENVPTITLCCGLQYNYVEITSNFINTFDLLSDINPEFVDIDNDSDMDLILGTDFDPSSFPWAGKLVILENIGLDENNEPKWEVIDTEYLGNELGNNLSPVFVDIDSDDDQDLFIGNFNGNILFYENINGENYLFIEEIEGVDLSGYSTPEFADLDNDHDYDILIGEMNGNIYYYENIGNQFNYDFLLQSSFFEDINVNSRSNPATYDFDSDNDLDLFVGSGSGDLLCYENIGDNFEFNFILNSDKSYYDLGKNISPEIFTSNLNTALIAGLSTGGMYYIPLCGEDLNNDGMINIVDVVQLVNYILNQDSLITTENCADINSDSTIDILDIIYLVEYILENH